MECLTNIIGLTPSAVGTVPVGIDATTSNSGHYLAETEGLNWQIINQYGTGYALMDKARRLAVQEVATQLIGGMRGRYTESGEKFKGLIGQMSYKGLLTVEGPTVSFNILTPERPGVYLFIKKIGIIVNAPASIVVTYPGGTATIVTQANTASYANVDLQLPCDGTTYTFSYPTSVNYTPCANIINCGCSLKDTKYFGFMGGKANDPAYSFSLDASIECDYEKLMCLNVNGTGYNGYTNNVKVMGATVRYKAAYLLLSELLSDVNPNQVNAQDSATLEGRKNEFDYKYRELMNWWVSDQGITEGRINCYACTAPQGIRKGTFFR